MAIRFTSAQLNDVLKSLTTIDMGNGQVTGVSYNSIAPIEQRLGALRLPLGQTASRIELLAALRGARLEVTSAAGVVDRPAPECRAHDASARRGRHPDDDLSLVTDGGDVRSFELTPAVHVRILDRELRQDVSRYLDVVGSSREQDVRQMVISTAGTGERPLFVSYVSEVPIWKTTYRLVLRDQGAKPLAAGMGDRRQHHRRGLERRRALARRRRAAVVHPEHFAAVLRTASDRAVAAGSAC